MSTSRGKSRLFIPESLITPSLCVALKVSIRNAPLFPPLSPYRYQQVLSYLYLIVSVLLSLAAIVSKYLLLQQTMTAEAHFLVYFGTYVLPLQCKGIITFLSVVITSFLKLFPSPLASLKLAIWSYSILANNFTQQRFN